MVIDILILHVTFDLTEVVRYALHCVANFSF